MTNNHHALQKSLRKVFECKPPVKDQLADAAETSFPCLNLKHELLRKSNNIFNTDKDIKTLCLSLYSDWTQTYAVSLLALISLNGTSPMWAPRADGQCVPQQPTSLRLNTLIKHMTCKLQDFNLCEDQHERPVGCKSVLYQYCCNAMVSAKNDLLDFWMKSKEKHEKWKP